MHKVTCWFAIKFILDLGLICCIKIMWAMLYSVYYTVYKTKLKICVKRVENVFAKVFCIQSDCNCLCRRSRKIWTKYSLKETRKENVPKKNQSRKKRSYTVSSLFVVDATFNVYCLCRLCLDLERNWILHRCRNYTFKLYGDIYCVFSWTFFCYTNIFKIRIHQSYNAKG